MEKKRGRVRIDKAMVDAGLAPTRQKAQALVMAGCVFSGGARIEKPGHQIDPSLEIEVRGEDHPFVGRGGLKLDRALREFAVDPEGAICMDVGASTGGFTDCLLKGGARRVYAVDVGYGQLARRLAEDERVVVIDRTNIRNLDRGLVPDPIGIAVIDVSFISLSIVLPSVDPFLPAGASVVALIKPQFEVGRELVGKGGIVKDPASHLIAIERVRSAGLSLGWVFKGLCDSPILGAKGNKEFLIHFLKP